jgi:hypothetical protein
VGQEIELVRAYLSILQMRMGKRLAFEITVPEELHGIAFPPLMLPSLVENAIKHGLEPQREGGTVIIGAQLVDGKLRLTVADTGRGFAETVGAGVGLANIRERLAALYGGAAKLTLEENPPHGVTATIEVPVDASRAEASARVEAAAAAAPQASTFTPATEAAVPLSRSRRLLKTLATLERGWRRALIYLFYGLTAVAAVLAAAGVVGVTTNMFPVMFGDDMVSGPGGALIGTAGILLGFLGVVIAIAVVVAVIYGLGFLFAFLAVLIPLIFLVALSPMLAPLILVGLLIWWAVRKKDSGAMPASERPL